MAVKVRYWKGAWWAFIDHQGRRKARRVDMSQQLCEELEAYVGTSDGDPSAWLFPGREGIP